jgi:hypothetical protein
MERNTLPCGEKIEYVENIRSSMMDVGDDDNNWAHL